MFVVRRGICHACGGSHANTFSKARGVLLYSAVTRQTAGHLLTAVRTCLSTVRDHLYLALRQILYLE